MDRPSRKRPDIITREWVVTRVEALRMFVDQSGDWEVAHGFEDWLYTIVLESIGLGQCLDPKACAIATIKTEHISFVRHSA